MSGRCRILAGSDRKPAGRAGNAPWLAGLPLFHQMVVLEQGAGGNIVASTATDALQLTIATP